MATIYGSRLRVKLRHGRGQSPPRLLALKRKGRREYGVLAAQYTREFHEKWIQGGASADEPLVGSADIQSLADLANSYEVVRGMRAMPFGRDTIIQVGVAALVPLLPLALTVLPAFSSAWWGCCCSGRRPCRGPVPGSSRPVVSVDC